MLSGMCTSGHDVSSKACLTLLSEMYTSRHDVSSKACLTKGVSRNGKWRSVIFVLEVESYGFICIICLFRYVCLFVCLFVFMLCL